MTSTADQFRIGSRDHGPIRVLTFERPEKLNAFTATGYRQLSDALELAATDDGSAVCILTGRGRAFSSGADLSELERAGGPSEMGTNFDALLESLTRFPKPLMAAVNGLAVGFGATLLLFCDVVVVDETAEVTLPFVRMGTCVEAAGSWLLPRRVGWQQASWMLLSGGPVDADRAVSSGLAVAKAGHGRSLEDALTMAATLAEHPIPALEANKRLLRDGWDEAIAQAWARERSTMSSLADTSGAVTGRASR